MEIKKEFPHINFLEKEPMSRHTTFRIGGPAGLFASVQVADVAPLVSYCKTHDIPVTILGNGSNVLVGDQGIEGSGLILWQRGVCYHGRGQSDSGRSGSAPVPGG